ncbi:response regulator [Taibaiella soli]|uniref:DNA-binding response regulator n=1 Tax=Taibaiella soli TaxID=1649169 RepID=A0A2W2A9E9_9BACT|nr:response regulator transcription factor [Taibaiella soli]PZF71985.1 DNA-binding response regulator [Taibaiella soli]
MIKISITDDHPLILNGLESIIQRQNNMELCGSYRNGTELLEGLKKTLPDVLMLDIQMPGQQGDELAKIVSRLYPSVKMVALTNLDTVYHIKNMLQQGVLGYVLKTAPEAEIVAAIHAVNSGKSFLADELKDKVLRHTISSAQTFPEELVLTRREKEILQLVATNQTSQDIADKLFLSKRTVDHHRNNLLLKLGVKNAAALIKKAIDMGLID